jgi:hypothetical protein
MLAAMASGKWTPNERFIEDHIPDYRRRMGELRERFPGRFVSRERDRRRKDGSSYRMKDWRDTHATADYRDVLIPQVAAHRAAIEAEFAENTEPLRVEYKGEALYLTVGQVRMLGNAFVADMLLERYIDPWRGEGVVGDRAMGVLR